MLVFENVTYMLVPVSLIYVDPASLPTGVYPLGSTLAVLPVMNGVTPHWDGEDVVELMLSFYCTLTHWGHFTYDILECISFNGNSYNFE